MNALTIATPTAIADPTQAKSGVPVVTIGEITPTMLTTYRAELVARLDTRGQHRLSLASVALKRAALRTMRSAISSIDHVPSRY